MDKNKNKFVDLSNIEDLQKEFAETQLQVIKKFAGGVSIIKEKGLFYAINGDKKSTFSESTTLNELTKWTKKQIIDFIDLDTSFKDLNKEEEPKKK